MKIGFIHWKREQGKFKTAFKSVPPLPHRAYIFYHNLETFKTERGVEMEMYKGCPKGHPGPKGMEYMSMLEAYEFVSKSLGVNREDIPEFDSVDN